MRKFSFLPLFQPSVKNIIRYFERFTDCSFFRSAPVQFTIPHSNFLPHGGSVYGFTVQRGLDPNGFDSYLIR